MELFYVGTKVDCNTVRDAMNVVMGYPKPPVGSGLTQQQKDQAVAAWNLLTAEQRTDQAMAALLPGWTCQHSSLFPEPTPGTRFYCIIDSDLPALMATAVAEGRVLTLGQSTALLASLAAGVSALPANWAEE